MKERLQVNGQMKREPKVTGNEAVWVWFETHSYIWSSGPSEALAVARSLGNDQFKASTGRSDSFKKRHSVVWTESGGNLNMWMEV
jgi:hypothetical protein